MPCPRVFLDFAVDNAPYGRVVFELFTDTAPKTCENFRALCTGEKGLSPSGHPLYYKGTLMHRSINDFMIQGGDFTKRNGTGGESIYGGTFADEDLQRPLDSPALLCMANKGPNTNGSQFFITLQECPHLNGKHVVFGKVIRGFEDVVLKLAEVPVDDKSRPITPIIITSCGELELRKRKEQGVDEPSTTTRTENVNNKPLKKRKRRELTPEVPEPPPVHLDKKETEEEYDARLEREEVERQERERKQILLHIKKSFSEDTESTGVRYKGRGRMKYVDPEHQYRS